MVKFKSSSNKKKHAGTKKFTGKSNLIQKHKEKLFKKPKERSKHFKKQVKNLSNGQKTNQLKIKDKDSYPLNNRKIQKKKKKKVIVKPIPEENENSLDEDINEDDIPSDDNMSDENELPEMKNHKKKKGAASKYSISGDISEEDIDSDDNFSLDENELPTPPDETTSEEESSDEEPQESEKVEIVSQKNENENRTIFVGNLPKSINKTKLKKLFAKYGTVESVRLRCAPLSDPGIPKKIAIIKKAFHDERSNIHGFVRFSNIEEAKNALSANGQLYDENHHLRVDLAGIQGQHRRFDDKKAVFVGNLPFGAEEDQLRDHFADCGDIVCIRIVRDKYTSVGKGFAFINFAARHSVRLALEKDGIELNGRKLRIQKAFYNQEVEIVKEQQQKYSDKKSSQKRFKNNNTKGNKNVVIKFKKKKKKNNEGLDFQGFRSNKALLKRKNLNKKKKTIKKKKEVLKKILNTKGKEKTS